MLINMLDTIRGGVFKRYFFNSSWMMAEQFLRIVSGVFVGIYIARYLGPERFGILSYILAISTFITAISRLGMDAILVRELVSAPEKKQSLMGTAFWMMIVAALVSFIVVEAVIWNASETFEIKIYTSIIAASVFFTSFLVVDFYFQSQVKAKYSAICKSLALFLVSVLKLFLIFIQADLIWFVVAFLLDSVVLAIIFFIAAIKSKEIIFFSVFCWAEAKQMLKSAWPMVMGAVAIQLYMRIDQVMIRNMLGLQEVGVYSAAVRIYEAWAIVIALVTVSLLPAIIKLKQGSLVEYHKRLRQLFRLVIWLSVLSAAVVTMLSDYLMLFAFGVEYKDSAPVLDIIMWTSVFAAMGSVSARYFNAEKMERKFALRTALAVVINIGLNFVLIPIYGIKGAAIATLVCTFFANYLMDWFDRDLKVLLKIKHGAMFGHPFS